MRFQSGVSGNPAGRLIGHENLTKPHIAEAIQEAASKRSDRLDIDADLALGRLLQINQHEGLLHLSREAQ